MKTYGLIGYPLGHSFSKRFFTQRFEEQQSNEAYLNFEINPIDDLLDIVLNHPTLIGLNVTIPYKTVVIPFLHSTDPIASATGAVNTIRIERLGNQRILLHGYNTDVFGFTESLRPLLEIHHQKALVLGSGGASRAIVYALKHLGIETKIVTRISKKAEDLTYHDLTARIMSEYLLIVNTTPLGTYPSTETFPDIPYHLLTTEHLLYDLVYNPPVTKFLEQGIKLGAKTKNGLEMLQLQALKSYGIWNG